MINNRSIDQAFSDLRSTCGGVREDYFGLLYLERDYKVPREQAVNQIAFGGNDYGLDGFHFDEAKRNLYLFQFKYSNYYAQFKGSLLRLIDVGIERIFIAPNRDDSKNQILLQLRSCMIDNRALIDQVCFRFVFTGDPAEAERSQVLDKLREDLENKKYLMDQFFGERPITLVVEFRSAAGRIGTVTDRHKTHTFELPLTNLMVHEGPEKQCMHIGFIRLFDLQRMHTEMGSRFFERNIRYGLGESESVNRAIAKALKEIVLDQSHKPEVFAFNHNGITLFAERVEHLDGLVRLTAPRLLNGAQTVTSTSNFIEKNKDNPKRIQGLKQFESVRVLCKIITNASQGFVTSVTINNNRQNPVEPWNLHANDMIQLDLQDKFRDDLGIYYERQENAFDQLSYEDLEDAGIKEAKAIQMLKLAQTFLMTEGTIDRVNRMRQVYEDDRLYSQVFNMARLKADSRHIVLCYKIQYRLRKLTREIEQKGVNKYWFIARARYLLWALLCQGILNDTNLDKLADSYGTNMVIPADYSAHLNWLANARVRLLLAELIKDKAYAAKVAEQNLSFLRTNRAFDRCMEIAYKKWHWVHKKLK